jgi:Sulfotransferase family
MQARAGGDSAPAFPPSSRDGPPPDRSVKVVYIVGAARSGSTLLTSLLGEFPGFFAAAETRLLWHGLERRRCGCGREALDCAVWTQAIRGATSRSRLDPRAVLGLQGRTTRLWHLPATLLRSGSSKRLATYADVMSGLYAGLVSATGARVIVDSSKNASEALLLRRIPFVEAHLVHLVRDPRAVVFSWRRAALRGRAEKKYERTAATAGRWVAHNVGARIVGAAYGRTRASVVRYEDLVANPSATLLDLATRFGESEADIGWFDKPTRARSSRHMIGGNALREADGPIKLAEDVAWREALHRRDVAAVDAITWPLASRYGYGPGVGGRAPR